MTAVDRIFAAGSSLGHPPRGSEERHPADEEAHEATAGFFYGLASLLELRTVEAAAERCPSP
jgi:hypothetical protein